MGADEQAEAFLQNDVLEKAQAYARRGRRHAQVPIEELRELWVVAFKVWATDFRNPLLRAMIEDLESELVLRGEVPPHDRVKPEADKLSAQARRMLDALSPEERRRVGAEIQRELSAFAAAARTAKKN
jgi:hypothetical protein